MAEEQKPVEVPKDIKDETTPAALDETPAVTEAAATEAKPAEEKKDEDKEEKKDEDKEESKDAKKEVTPIEEGQLSHKAAGLSFPKNLIASKEHVFFGNEAFEPKALSAYKKAEKSTENANSNMAWASHTGKGLLFLGDKKAPTGIINLAEASEPEVDGSNKFHLTAKGNKHTFKAASTAERDNWVSQLKLKIAEAKEMSTSVTESETYKNTLESFKPAVPAKKEEETAEAPKEEEAKADESSKTEEPAKEAEAAKEEPKEEPKKDELKTPEEPKRRSTSRKRASFFGFGKKEEKKEDIKEEAKPAEETAAAETPATEAAEATTAEEAKPAEETPAADQAAEEEKPAESPKEKFSKRNSFFGGVFAKKDKKPAEAKPEESAETPKEEDTTAATAAATAPVEGAEAAPVIPPVEATTPLSADVSNPATAPTETTEATANNTEAKKDTKEKRKSSLPFNFGKREKSPAPAEGDEKSGKGAFSKLRATINRKSTAAKSEDKPAEEAAKEESKDEAKAEESKAETTTDAPKAEEPIKTVEPEAETKPEGVAGTTPVVTAAA